MKRERVLFICFVELRLLLLTWTFICHVKKWYNVACVFTFNILRLIEMPFLLWWLNWVESTASDHQLIHLPANTQRRLVLAHDFESIRQLATGSWLSDQGESDRVAVRDIPKGQRGLKQEKQQPKKIPLKGIRFGERLQFDKAERGNKKIRVPHCSTTPLRPSGCWHLIKFLNSSPFVSPRSFFIHKTTTEKMCNFKKRKRERRRMRMGLYSIGCRSARQRVIVQYSPPAVS